MSCPPIFLEIPEWLLPLYAPFSLASLFPSYYPRLMSNVIIYHKQDLDGMCSGAIAYRALGSAELIPYNYGDEVDLPSLAGKDVYLVDCSFPVEQMLALQQAAASLTWIDHHVSAIDAAAAASFNPPGLRDLKEAACELTWRFFHSTPLPSLPDPRPLQLPWVIYLLGRYDCWDHQADPDVLPFQYGMRALGPLPPESPRWPALLELRDEDVMIDRLVQEGEVILRYETHQYAEYVRSLSFPCTLDGHPTLAVNRGRAGSTLFNALWDPSLYDLMLTFVLSPKGTWQCSLYSTKPEIDCSQIAKARGGGGHPGAAGFESSFLPVSPSLSAAEVVKVSAISSPGQIHCQTLRR